MAVGGGDRPGDPTLGCLTLLRIFCLDILLRISLPGSALMGNQVAADQLVRGGGENYSPATESP